MEREHREARTVWPSRHLLHIIYALSFVDLLAVGIIFPFFGGYVISMGCTHTQVGLVASIYAALQVISGPIIGSWSDVRGRKPVFCFTLVTSALCYFFMGFCTTPKTLFIWRLLLGIFKHTQTLNKAIIADFTERDKALHTFVYGRCTAFASMGFVIGPMIGGQLSDYHNGFQYICTFTAFLFVINTILACFLPDMEESHPRNEELGNSLKCELVVVLRDLKLVDWSRFWNPFVLKLLFVLVTTMFFATQPEYLKQSFGAGKFEVGCVISFVSFVGMVCGFWIIPLTKLLFKSEETSRTTMHIFLVLALCFVGFAVNYNAILFVILLLPFGACNTILRVLTMELVFEKSHEHEHGSLTGVADSIMSLGRLMAPITAGYLTDALGVGGVMLFATLFSSLGIALSYRLYRTEEAEKEKTD